MSTENKDHLSEHPAVASSPVQRADHAAQWRAEREQAEADARDAATRGFSLFGDVIGPEDIVEGGVVHSGAEYTMDIDGVRKLTSAEREDRRLAQRAEDLWQEAGARADAAETAAAAASVSQTPQDSAAALSAAREYTDAYSRYERALAERVALAEKMAADEAEHAGWEADQEHITNLQFALDELEDRAADAASKADAVPGWRFITARQARQAAARAKQDYETARIDYDRASINHNERWSSGDPHEVLAEVEQQRWDLHLRETTARAARARIAAGQVPPTRPFARARARAIADGLARHAEETRARATEFARGEQSQRPDDFADREFWNSSIGEQRRTARTAEDTHIADLRTASIEADRAFDDARMTAATARWWRPGERAQAQTVERATEAAAENTRIEWNLAVISQDERDRDARQMYDDLRRAAEDIDATEIGDDGLVSWKQPRPAEIDLDDELGLG